MNYLWEKFNIKTFPAETIVFVDGVFMPELSTLPNTLKIDKSYKLPIHIICVGEITGLFDINCEILAPNTSVFLTIKLSTKTKSQRSFNLPAFLNIFIKNTGKNSSISGKIIVQNYGQAEINEKAGHFAQNTGIFLSTKVVAHCGSVTKLSGVAEIAKDCDECKSDINFAALCARDAKIEFTPAQRISAAPTSAAHGAHIWRGTNAQIEYLRTAGMTTAEIKEVLEEAFIGDAD